MSLAILVGGMPLIAAGPGKTVEKGKDFTGYPYEPVPFTSVKVHDAVDHWIADIRQCLRIASAAFLQGDQ